MQDDTRFERVSRGLATFAGVTLWLVPAVWLARAVIMIAADQYGVVRWEGNGWVFSVGSGPTLPHPWLNLATEVPWMAIAMAGIWRLRVLARTFAAHGPFAAGAPEALRHIAHLFFLAALIPHVMFGEGNGINVNFGFEALLPGGALLFVSWILARGRQLAVENSLTV